MGIGMGIGMDIGMGIGIHIRIHIHLHLHLHVHTVHYTTLHYMTLHCPVAPPCPSDIVRCCASDHAASRRRTPRRRLVPEGLPAGPVFTQQDMKKQIQIDR